MRLAALTLLVAISATAHAQDIRLEGSYRHNEAGWTYVHLAGTPAQIGFQHGYLLAREIEDNVHVYSVEAPNLYQRDWSFFRDAARTILWPHLEPQYQVELLGIAAGLKANGSKVDLWDVVAVNGDEELTGYYLPWLNAQQHKPSPPAAVPPGKSSWTAHPASSPARTTSASTPPA